MVAKAKFEIRADDKTKKTFDRIRSSLKGLGTGFAIMGTAAAAGFIAMEKRAINLADEIQKLAIKTGATTETLSGLKRAAELGGSSLETVAKVMIKLQKTTADAQDGLATQADAYKELGINVDAFAKLKPAQQLEVLADAMNGLGNQSRRTALELATMGRGGNELRTILKGGAEGLREMHREAEKAGEIISQDLADSAAEANDAIRIMKGHLNGLAIQMAGPFAESVMIASSAFEDLALLMGLIDKQSPLKIARDNMKELEGSSQALEFRIGSLKKELEKSRGGAVFARDVNELSGIIAVAESKLNSLVPQVKDAREEFEKLSKANKPAVLSTLTVYGKKPPAKDDKKISHVKVIKEEIDAVEELLKQMERQATIVELNESQLKLWDLAAAGATESQYKLGEELVKTQVHLEKGLELQHKHEEELRRTAEQMDSLARSVNEAADPYIEFNKLQEDLNVLLKDGRIEQDAFDKAIKNSVEGVGELDDKFKDLESAIKGWSSTFADALVEGDANFSSFIESLTKQMLKIAITEASQPFFDGFGDIVSGLFSNLPGRASGGPVSAGNAYIVGEHRPELFIPNNSGTIIPSLDGLGGTSQINTTINVYSDGSSATKSDAIEFAKNLESVVTAQIIKQKRQGGILA